jgi:LysM repeat protein
MVLPGLAIASIVYALHGVNIWIILAVVVVLNALGAPIKSFRSAFLQAKEAPYIEMARSYGASDFRIITRYLVPRILPVLIPYLVMQIPTFIFLEATLGFFRIRSIYPSWGRIIYEGLSQGALYGSPFWVLQPIFLLLLTGLAFAMLGLALERILNPRVIADIPATSRQPKSEADEIERRQRNVAQAKFYRRLLAGALVIFLAAAIFVPTGQGKTLASIFISYLDPSRAVDTRIRNFEPTLTQTPRPKLTASSTTVPLDSASTQPFATLIPEVTSSPTTVEKDTPTSAEPPATPIPTSTRPATYTLQRGEYPYCIARRLNVDPGELLALNGLLNQQTFYAGTVLQIPQTANAYPGERMQQAHPTTYTVSRADETFYTIACAFGDVDPQELAQANGLSIGSALYVGQQLNVR